MQITHDKQSVNAVYSLYINVTTSKYVFDENWKYF